ncbi:glutathione S-transferase C-terminal domain-containing protein [Trichonephila clavipes]|nr:glutathione S-transferase C-terminal domain-containing protein [Trichonephila clavipes]
MNSDDLLILSARINEEQGTVEATIESSICLFVYAYCGLELKVHLIDDKDDYDCKVSSELLKIINYEFFTKKMQHQELYLTFPAIRADNGKTLIAGISSVLRWAIKSQLAKYPDHYTKALLGFRGGCLVACAENSLWTKFCELQLPRSVSEMASTINKNVENVISIPESLVLLEAHFNRPVRTHNILKRKLDIVKCVKHAKSNETSSDVMNSVPTDLASDDGFTIYDSNKLPLETKDISETLQSLVITEKSHDFYLNHIYLEGIDLTLTDMITFPCVYYLLKNLPAECMQHLQNIEKWYKRMCSNVFVKKTVETFGFSLEVPSRNNKSGDTYEIIVPVVDKESLYKRDHANRKMRCKHKNPTEIITFLQNASIYPQYGKSYCDKLEWENLPPDLHPLAGGLPDKRIDRKCQQIESMVTAALFLAKDGQTIVEFCAGGGHIGLLIAYLLPSCKVILIENKESSLVRAKERAASLNLQNVFFLPCNMDYFKGSFDLGVSLHACGFATDQVIQQCISRGASFACCPCCYGGIHNTNSLSYPLSKKFCSTSLSYQKYHLLTHCADRTEVNTPTAEQGEICMGLIDTDRVFLAQEYGYEVTLTTLQPKSCSTKHNLIIGKSPKLLKHVD